MKTIKWPTGFILAAVIAFAGLLGVSQLLPSSESEATVDHHGCPANKMCGWKNANMHGGIQITTVVRETLGSFNDEYSSLMNRTDVTAWFSENSHCGGHQTWVRAGDEDTNLDNGWWFDQNDEISSVHRDNVFSSHAHCN